MKRLPRIAGLLALSFLAAVCLGEDAPKHDAITPVSREGGWMKRHESFNERVKQGNVDLIFIGDSITQSWEGSSKRLWQDFYGKRNAVNLGISGDRTQHVLWRLEHGNIDGIKPKAAVVMIGTNNSAANSPEQIAEGITAIVKQLREKLPETQILLLAIFPRGETPADKRRQVNEKANAIIAKLDDGKFVHYLDIGPKFLLSDGTISRETMPDWLHLTEPAYLIWAEAIEPKLAELLGEKTSP